MGFQRVCKLRVPEVGQELIETLLSLVCPHFEQTREVDRVMNAVHDGPMTQQSHVKIVYLRDFQCIYRHKIFATSPATNGVLIRSRSKKDG